MGSEIQNADLYFRHDVGRSTPGFRNQEYSLAAPTSSGNKLNDLFTRYFSDAGFEVLAMEGMDTSPGEAKNLSR